MGWSRDFCRPQQKSWLRVGCLVEFLPWIINKKVVWHFLDLFFLQFHAWDGTRFNLQDCGFVVGTLGNVVPPNSPQSTSMGDNDGSFELSLSPGFLGACKATDTTAHICAHHKCLNGCSCGEQATNAHLMIEMSKSERNEVETLVKTTQTAKM